jgi:hypothetical protein
MLNARETRIPRKVSNVSVLHRVQKTRVQFVGVMVELILTHKFCRENLVCLKHRLLFSIQEPAVSIGSIYSFIFN